MKTDDLKQKRIAVLMGGVSSEREVSLGTGKGVLAALEGLGYRTVGVDWKEGENPARLLEEAGAEVVWLALHGTRGEDGAVQGLLECLGLPYTGSGILASALAMDKVASKRMFEVRGLATPAWRLLEGARGAAETEEAAEALGLPLVVKPAREGSSVGVSIAESAGELDAAVASAANYGPTLLEAYVAGAELHVGVLSGEVLGTIEVRPAVGFYDYEAKYKRDDTGYIIPPGVPTAEVRAAEALALAAYRTLGCAGHARVDIRVSAEGTPYLLEVNTLPGMTGHSLLPKIAAHRGISYATLCERILESALRRQGPGREVGG